MAWCSTGVVPEWCSCGGVFVVVCSTGVVLELYFSGGVVLGWCFCGDRWCGGVFVLVFLWWWCFCDGVFVFFFCQGSIFVALPRRYAKSIDNTGVKRCLV